MSRAQYDAATGPGNPHSGPRRHNYAEIDEAGDTAIRRAERPRPTVPLEPVRVRRLEVDGQPGAFIGLADAAELAAFIEQAAWKERHRGNASPVAERQLLALRSAPLEKLSSQVLDLARITGSDLNETVKVSGELFVNWKVPADQMSATLDKLYRASQLSGVGVDQIAAQVTAAGPVFRELGIDIDHATAIVAKLGEAGVDAKPILLGLNRSIADFAKDGVDPVQAIASVIEQIKGAADPVDAARVAVENFGTRGGLKVADAIKAGRLEVDDFVHAIQSGGSTIEQSGEDTKHFTDRLKELGNVLEADVGPAAGKVVDAMASATKFVADHADNAAVKVALIGASALAIGVPTVAILGKIGSGLVGIASTALKVGAAIKTGLANEAAFIAAEVSAKGFAGALSTIGPAAAKLGIVAAAGYALYSAFRDADESAEKLAKSFESTNADTFGQRVGKLNAEIGKLNDLQRENESRSLFDKAGAQAAGILHLTNDTNAATASQAALNDQINRLTEQIAGDQATIDKWRAAIAAVAGEFHVSAERADELIRSANIDPSKTGIPDLTKRVHELTDATAGGAEGLDHLKTKQKELEAAVLGASDAQKSYRDSLEKIADAERNAEKSTERVAEAQLSYTKAVRSVEEAQRSAIKAVEAITDAHQGEADSIQAIADAEQAQIDAYAKVADAERALTEAQEELTRARADDIDKQLKQQEVAQKIADAQVRLLDDEEKLHKARATGSASDVRDAQSELDRGRLEVAKSQRDAEKDREDSAKNIADKTAAVTAAQKDLADAQRDVARSGDDIAKAHRDAAKAAEAVRDAEYDAGKAAQAVRDSQRDATKAAEGIRDAQYDATKAHQAVTGAQNDAARAALELSHKIDDQATAVHNDGSELGPLLGSLEELKRKYPEVAAAVQPYIDQITALRKAELDALGPTPDEAKAADQNNPPPVSLRDRSVKGPNIPQNAQKPGTAASGGERSGVTEVSEDGLEVAEKDGKTYMLGSAKVIPAQETAARLGNHVEVNNYICGHDYSLEEMRHVFTRETERALAGVVN